LKLFFGKDELKIPELELKQNIKNKTIDKIGSFTNPTKI
jgi:hypothetical protein